MKKQNNSTIPDYSLFHREINNTSSPINHSSDQKSNSSSSSSSSKKFPHFETICNEYSNSHLKLKLNSYASTDEDVDEFNLDYPEVIDRSETTIQTYRDRLNARLNIEQNEVNFSQPRILSIEHSQITLDSGVDIASEQKFFQTKTDEQYSEQTANQNDLFALSDDSLLDIESTQMNDRLGKTPPIIKRQSISLTDESDEGKSYLTAITDFPIVHKTERGPSNTSDQYYSADSEFNTSLSFANNNVDKLENISDDYDNDDERHELRNSSSEHHSISSSAESNFKFPSFGDWIDQVFTNFLVETKQQSNSTSLSSSIISMHESQNTVDTSSSQILTVIENKKNNQSLIIISKNSIASDNNDQRNSLHHQAHSSSIDEEQQQSEIYFKGSLSCLVSLSITKKQEMHTGCNKIIAPCTLYTKKGIFYFCNSSHRLIYMYVR